MDKSLIEEIYYSHYEDEPDNEEVLFYYNALYDDLKLFAAPQYKDEVEGHFYGLICGLTRSSEVQAFKRGLAYALRLSAECSISPSDFTKAQTEDNYRRVYKEESERSENLSRALEADIPKDGNTRGEKLEEVKRLFLTLSSSDMLKVRKRSGQHIKTNNEVERD